MINTRPVSIGRPRSESPTANPVRPVDPTWVSVAEAARFCRRSSSTVYAWCRAGRLTDQHVDGKRVVALDEALLLARDKDVDALLERVAATAAEEDLPAVVRYWIDGWRRMVEPVMVQLAEALARAELAEARLELLSRRDGDPPA